MTRVALSTSEIIGRTLLVQPMRNKAVGKGCLVPILDIYSRGLTSFSRVSYGDWDLSATFAESVSNAHLILCDDVDTCDGVQDDGLNQISIDIRCNRKQKRGYQVCAPQDCHDARKLW
jgi:hypothetical protein